MKYMLWEHALEHLVRQPAMGVSSGIHREVYLGVCCGDMLGNIQWSMVSDVTVSYGMVWHSVVVII